MAGVGATCGYTGTVCTLLLYRRPLPGVALAVAAARDELHARAVGGWARLSETPEVWGGHDPEAGGSWLALSGSGFLVAVTNARLGARRREGQRSRGLLVLDLAAEPTAGTAADRLRREPLARYAPANVVVASPARLVVATNVPRPEVRELETVTLALGNRPAFEGDPRVEALLELGRPRPGEGAAAWTERLVALLARHEHPVSCRHAPAAGTVSATVALLGEGGWRARHAGGPPCRTPLEVVPAPGPGARGER